MFGFQQRQVVNAITLTPVRHKHHMQFLTSAPNFRGRGGGKLTPMTQHSRAPDGKSPKTR